MPRSEFERGYRVALRHVIAMSCQHWDEEAQPSIDKFIAQIKNFRRHRASTAKRYEDNLQLLLAKGKTGKKR